MRLLIKIYEEPSTLKFLEFSYPFFNHRNREPFISDPIALILEKRLEKDIQYNILSFVDMM